MLKKIPHEDQIINFTVKKISGTAQRFKKKAISKAKEIRQKIHQEIRKKDEQLIAKTTIRLGNFVEKGKNWTYQEIDNLIENLQRMILALQRKKSALMQKAVCCNAPRKSSTSRKSSRKTPRKSSPRKSSRSK